MANANKNINKLLQQNTQNNKQPNTQNNKQPNTQQNKQPNTQQNNIKNNVGVIKNNQQPTPNSNVINATPNILEKGINTVSNTLGDIRNSIMGNNSNKPKNNNYNRNLNDNLKKIIDESTDTVSKNNKTNKINNAVVNNTAVNKAVNNAVNNNKANILHDKVNKDDSFVSMNTITKYISDKDESIWYLVLKVIILVIVLVALYYIGNYLMTKYITNRFNTPMLLNTTKNAKQALVISQDPTSINYIPIKISDGQDGIQFTYSFWFLIDNFDYKKGEWKHIFHKGNSSSYPNRAPGVWFHPDKNTIRVYMNTMDNVLEYADIDNIPVRKWVYMCIILTNKNLDLYINGYLKIRKELSSIPKQNDDDFWVNMYGGFEGYLSNIRYYAYSIDFNEINDNIKNGPSKNNCIDTGEIPPYLDDNWWFSYNG